MLIVHALWEGEDGEDHVGRYRLVHKHKFAVTIIIIMGCTIYDVIYKTTLFFILDFRNGHLPLAKYLIEDVKCSPTGTDTNGWTPLHEACR